MILEYNNLVQVLYTNANVYIKVYAQNHLFSNLKNSTTFYNELKASKGVNII